MKTDVFTKIGAGFYVLWGLLHVVGAIALFSSLRESADSALSALTSNVSALPSVGTNVAVEALFGYYLWLLLVLAIFSIVIAVRFNWRGIAVGYWLNLLMLGATEVGILLFLLIPGYMKMSEGGIGLSLYILAAAFSTVGFIRSVKN